MTRKEAYEKAVWRKYEHRSSDPFLLYKIVRFYRDNRPARTIETGLTLEEAKAHCKDPETSSTTASAIKCKRIKGEWFDGYERH